MNYIVYKHTCPNGRCYIGITRRKAERRWRSGMGYEPNKRFFMSIVKYGWDNIKHEILESDLSYEEAKAKEEEYIKKYKSNEEQHGYNQTLGVGSKGYARSIETREKLSKAHLGIRQSAEARKKISDANKGKWVGGKSPAARKVYQYDRDGNFIREWASQSDAARYYGCYQASISKCVIGEKKTAKGFIWKDKRV